MKPLDYDLRVRIIDAIEAGEKMPRVAARFGVSYAVVKKLKYQYRDTGNVDSHMDRCGRKPIRFAVGLIARDWPIPHDKKAANSHIRFGVAGPTCQH